LTNWGPSGQTVYERTYSRTLHDGSKETWPDTVRRVAAGNLALVYGEQETWPVKVWDEYTQLVEHIEAFKILPAGRHLWASGVKGRQYLMNCWTSGWGEKLSDHFSFTFLRLMEGGGVGANYSTRHLEAFGLPNHQLNVHIICDPSHPDYDEMLFAGVLSKEYDPDFWDGAFEVEDSREGWADALTDLIDTFMRGDEVKHTNRVFDVSRVRGCGARLKTFGGTASGPLPFAVMMHKVAAVLNGTRTTWRGSRSLTPMEAMEIDHAIAECVVSGGNRRSARMSIVHWRDPSVLDFIDCKADHSHHWTTNISVEVDDAFFEAIERDDEWALTVHDAVVLGMLTNGEPGYWNSSLSNQGELEPVYATNPCGEITLQPWEACNLGHVNMDAFANGDAEGLVDAHKLVTRFLLRATYADINDPKSRQVQDANRRIGVGHLGVQGFLVKQGVRYSEAPASEDFRMLLRALRLAVREAARDYAFELRIPEPVKVTTVAPTGSIAKLPGVTEGIHPIYARFFERRIRFSMNDPAQEATVERAKLDGFEVEVDGYDQSGRTAIVVYPTKDPLVEQVEALGFPAELVESADELSVSDMLRFQACYQENYADNAVSFTVNVKPDAHPAKVSETILDYLPRLKGTTIMVDESRPQAPYTRITRAQYEQATRHTVEDAIDLDCATGACPIR
jgi:adenosylcobalamin-dependent ribonucleoside-triphosphate reductase